jgi:hypothetical protein
VDTGAAPGTPNQTGFDADFLAALGGEEAAVLVEGLTVEHREKGRARTRVVEPATANARDQVDLMRAFGRGWRVAYAQVYVHSDTAQQAYFDFGFNDTGKVWVNGTLAYTQFTTAGRQCAPGTDPFRATLQPGWNRVLVKSVDAGGRAWEFMAEVYGEDGLPLRTATTPDSKRATSD